MRKLLIGFIGLVVIVVGAGLLLTGPLFPRVIERVVASNMAMDRSADLPDGLHLVVCGAGSPMPSDMAGPCLGVIAGDRVFVVDAGSGGSRNLGMMRFPQGDIEAVFLTHFHSDHIDGLGELMMNRWVQGTNTEPVPVYGPQGVERIVAGFNMAYGPDTIYRVAHHGPETVPPGGQGGVARPYPLPRPGEAMVLIDDNGLKVTAFKVDHAPIDEAVGYLFEYGGRSLVISGDTNANANLEKFAQGVDLLAHEGLAANIVKIMQKVAEETGNKNIAKIMFDIQDYHATPAQAAAVAERAGAKHLLFYHIVPPILLAPQKRLFLEGVDDAYSGPFTVSVDGTVVIMPAGSDDITLENWK
ncbi:MAG: MBL fold metallo-hydrolase [Alphaproteobacteria bacterium]